MRNFIINLTEREGLLYQSIQELKYKLGKLLNSHNYLLRGKRIKQFLRDNKQINIQFGAGSGKLGEAKKNSFRDFFKYRYIWENSY